MQPRLEVVKEKKLVGKRMQMSLAEDKTFELWRSFMPDRMKIANKLSDEFISMRVYNESFHLENPGKQFEKWAAVEVSDFSKAPEGMETFTLSSGLYAIFDYKGLNTDNSIFIYIFTQWLPNSNYELDDRPHFEVLGKNYKNNDPESEEEILVPIRLKQ